MRYVVLVLINLPIIFLAFLNLFIKYKLGRISKLKLYKQALVWVIILAALIGSFPVYNTIKGNAALDSSELSLFDIFQTTAIVLLMYVANDYRQKIDQSEKRLRDLHQQLSIKMSGK